ncbi:MAG: glucose-6-phosphate dehydrogenase assembly protein OpcA [Spirochaetia bacterium]
MIVDVTAVEQELARIQRELTNSEVRTSLFNLVVFGRNAEETMANDALNFLLGKRAARVIHIVNSGADGSRRDESGLDVSARCFIDAERKSVCFQEIVITNGSDGAGGAPGSWVPLLVRDIPTFILWQDTLCDKQELLAHAQEQAEKLLVDTEQSVAMGDPEDAILEVVHRIAITDGIPVSDFAFKRLRALQRVVASAFDDPKRTPLLDEISSVHLAGTSSLSGRLFSLWLADRIGWTIDGEHFRDRRNRTVTFHHTEKVAGSEFEVQIDLVTNARIQIATQTAGPANGELLLEEVDAIGGDALYRNALRILAG